MYKYRNEILEYLRKIPVGKVTTYKQIALYLGDKNLSRYVGNVLHSNEDKDKYPCYKVVSSKGELSPSYAFGGIEEQKRRLNLDGIEVKNNRVNLNKYLYK